MPRQAFLRYSTTRFLIKLRSQTATVWAQRFHADFQHRWSFMCQGASQSRLQIGRLIDPLAKSSESARDAGVVAS
jgi:hypothetical protein